MVKSHLQHYIATNNNVNHDDNNDDINDDNNDRVSYRKTALLKQGTLSQTKLVATLLKPCVESLYPNLVPEPLNHSAAQDPIHVFFNKLVFSYMVTTS